MGGCAAVNCSNHSRSGFRMFRFPEDSERRKKWIVNCRRENWEPGRGAELCIAHFEESQFELHRQDGWKRLKLTAVPTVFDVSNPPQSLSSKRKKGIGLPKPGKLMYRTSAASKSEESSGEEMTSTPCGEVHIKEEPIETDSYQQPWEDFMQICFKEENVNDDTEVEPNEDANQSFGENDDSTPSTSHEQTQRSKTSKQKKRRANEIKKANTDEEEYEILTSDSARDEWTVYGEFIGNKMRKLPPTTQIHVKHIFGNVLYKAALGLYES